ncbi:UNVERIFIED_CONTAM: hypothetical protein Sradi_2808600 [Sesamum radiatum]|uniref:Gag-pol polyprotein n=1 Tax=Sesamum radiatum TaxID=300843 RepID=A0AAW2RVN2_SESRA
MSSLSENYTFARSDVLPLREIPGGYGLPFFGPIKDVSTTTTTRAQTNSSGTESRNITPLSTGLIVLQARSMPKTLESSSFWMLSASPSCSKLPRSKRETCSRAPSCPQLISQVDIGSTSSSAEKGKLENKKAKDSEALYYIQTAVADHIFSRISVATSAKEAWGILQKEYQGSAKVRIIKLQTLRRDFENMKMKDSETIDEYYTKVRELVNQLKAYGEDIPEKRVVENSLENAFQSKLNMRSQNSNRKEENYKSTMGDKNKPSRDGEEEPTSTWITQKATTIRRE